MPDSYTGPERRSKSRGRRNATDRRSGMDRRRGPGRRRGEVRKAAEEGEISGELLDFIMAIDEYKRINERPFPTWSEIFEIVQYLGYRKVASVAQHINTASGSEVLESAAGARDAEVTMQKPEGSTDSGPERANSAGAPEQESPVVAQK